MHPEERQLLDIDRIHYPRLLEMGREAPAARNKTDLAIGKCPFPETAAGQIGPFPIHERALQYSFDPPGYRKSEFGSCAKSLLFPNNGIIKKAVFLAVHLAKDRLIVLKISTDA